MEKNCRRKEMANFMGGVRGNRGEVTRLGSSIINSWVKSGETKGYLGLIKDLDDIDTYTLEIRPLNYQATYKLFIEGVELTKEEIILFKKHEQFIKEQLKKLETLEKLED